MEPSSWSRGPTMPPLLAPTGVDGGSTSYPFYTYIRPAIMLCMIECGFALVSAWTKRVRADTVGPSTGW